MLILKQCQFVALSGTTKNTWWVSPNLCQSCLLQQFNHEVQVIKRVLTHVWPDCIVQHFSIWAMHVKSWVESNRLLGWRLVLWRFHRISLNFAIKGGEVAGPTESLYSVYIANRNSSNSELKSARGSNPCCPEYWGSQIQTLQFLTCSSAAASLHAVCCGAVWPIPILSVSIISLNAKYSNHCWVCNCAFISPQSYPFSAFWSLLSALPFCLVTSRHIFDYMFNWNSSCATCLVNHELCVYWTINYGDTKGGGRLQHY